jgi:hypothetical protein
MDLEELCQAEGLDADELQRTVQWARTRSEEIVAGLVADAELGPILDAVWEDESGLNRLPVRAADPEVAAAPAPESDPIDEEMAPVDVGALVDDVLAHSEQGAANGARPEVAAANGATDQGEAQAASADPGLPDEADDEITAPQDPPSNLRDMLAGGARPALEQPPMGESTAPSTKEMTQEIEVDDIELLDDDDLELVDDEPEPSDAVDEPPEWQQALNSAALGGGAEADHDSGLLRMPGRPARSTAHAGEPEAAAKPPSEASSVDVDLSDLD